MKRVLLTTAALVAISTIPAHAAESALQLGLGGYISGYAVYTDQETASGDSRREFDFRKDTEVHLTGEVALDNGITAGAHLELLADRFDGNDDATASTANASTTVEESYLYLSSSWGRINFGEEDGAAYLLQVAAPSADDNVDGLRSYIDTFDYLALSSATTGVGVGVGTLDYAHDVTGYANKFTYITPVFNGFQGAVSYTPSLSEGDQDALAAVASDDDAGDFDDAFEFAARYEGSFEALDVAIGAGYTMASTERDAAGTAAVGTDDLKVWNVGANIGWGAFGLGAAYLSSNNGIDAAGDTDTWVAGIDYTTGPYKLGLSYLNSEAERNAAAAIDGGFTNEVELERWTAGAIYEWGPGMTFRGAVSLLDADTAQAGDTERDATQVTLGTQLNF